MSDHSESDPKKPSSKRKREEEDEKELPQWVYWVKLIWDSFAKCQIFDDHVFIPERFLNNHTDTLPQSWPECAAGKIPKIKTVTGEITVQKYFGFQDFDLEEDELCFVAAEMKVDKRYWSLYHTSDDEVTAEGEWEKECRGLEYLKSHEERALYIESKKTKWVWDLVDIEKHKSELKFTEHDWEGEGCEPNCRHRCKFKYKTWAILVKDVMKFYRWSRDHKKDLICSVPERQQRACMEILKK